MCKDFLKTYGKLCTLIYDIDKPFAAMEEMETYIKFVDFKEDSIIEPMCGSGRFYIPLLKDGFRITGYDLSEQMLNACESKCKKSGLTPDIFQADITTYKTIKKYKYVFIPIGSISLLVSDQEILRSFRNIYECLDKNGLFIFSFLGIEDKTENCIEWKEVMRYPIGDNKEITCNQKLRYSEYTNVMDIKLHYQLLNDNEVIENEYQDFPIKLSNKIHMVNFLEKIGFTEIEEVFEINQKNNCKILKCKKT